MRREKLASKVRIYRWAEGKGIWTTDQIAVEEPLEIRVIVEGEGRKPTTERLAVTMRTPGDDLALAAGFLVSEGLLSKPSDLSSIRFCVEEGKEEQAYNAVSLELQPGIAVDLGRLQRKVLTSSSCGVCGKASLEAVEALVCQPLPPASIKVDPSVILGSLEEIRAEQGGFAKTGGLHGAGFFGLDGTLQRLREDIGRHNAVDKLVGSYFLEGRWPLEAGILWVSGRASFEIVQKAWMAGIAWVFAVGPPSDLAVELAKRAKIALIGFLRPDRFNLYCGAERIAFG